MNRRYSPSVFVLRLFSAATLSVVFFGEIANDSTAALAEVKQEKRFLKIVNESGKQTTISEESFAKLPHQTVKAKDHTGALGTYDGVAMVELLRVGKAKVGKDLKGPLLANCVLVEAADNYRVVFSLVEVDPELTDNIVLVADRRDGKAFDDKEGPYRLVVPGDKRHMRWVKQVTQIAVRPVGEVVVPN